MIILFISFPFSSSHILAYTEHTQYHSRVYKSATSEFITWQLYMLVLNQFYCLGWQKQHEFGSTEINMSTNLEDGSIYTRKKTSIDRTKCNKLWFFYRPKRAIFKRLTPWTIDLAMTRRVGCGTDFPPNIFQTIVFFCMRLKYGSRVQILSIQMCCVKKIQ